MQRVLVTTLLFLAACGEVPGQGETKPHSPPAAPLAEKERLNGRALTGIVKEALKEARQSILSVEKTDGTLVALGTAISSDGYLITKGSEIAAVGIDNLRVRLPDGSTTEPQLRAVQKANDLALLKVFRILKPVEWKETETLKAGHWVTAPSADGKNLKLGIIGAVSRAIEREGGVLGVRIGPRQDRGVLVINVFENSGAQKAGIKSGDVILFVAGEAIYSPEELTDIVTRYDADESIEIVVERKSKKKALKVVLGYRREVFDLLERNQMLSGDTSKRRAGFEKVLQHDIPLPPAAMGGPLYSLDGKVIGVNIARRDRVTTFALPSELSRRITEELRSESTETGDQP